MTIKVLSDTAVVIELADAPGPGVERAVQSLTQQLGSLDPREIQEIVPGITAIALHFRPEADLLSWLDRLTESLPRLTKKRVRAKKGRQRVVPVVYGSKQGPDLARVARHAGLSAEDVIRRHLAGDYRVVAMGFSPGFPYLAGLDPALACPRRDSPRRRVPAGTVGIGGSQTGVYPQELPGGWNLIGRTAQRLFDPDAAEPSWLRVGDRVRFIQADEPASFPAVPRTEAVKPEKPSSDLAAVLEVLDGGVQTTVQDRGRPGFQSIGVTEGGALNPRGLATANLLVGNVIDAPALEWALQGPKLRFSTRTLVALAGCAVVDRPLGRPFWIQANETLDLSRLVQPGRGYLAVAGGIQVPVKLGATSTHVAAGFGGWQGRALRQGDSLPIGPSAIAGVSTGWGLASSFHRSLVAEVTALRVVRGPEADRFSPAAWRLLLASPYQVSTDSNRMGFRLQGPAVEPVQRVEMVSQPVALGTVQIPPDGQPLVLMAERQAVGGYPRMATVISADIPELAQVPMGGTVTFVEVTLADAQMARHQAQRDLRLLATGLRSRLKTGS